MLFPWAKRKTTTVTVDVRTTWLRAARHPAIMWPVASLTGVVPTFVPAYLYHLGSSGVPWHHWRVVTGCVLVYAMALFYGGLGGAVMTRAWELRKHHGELQAQQ